MAVGDRVDAQLVAGEATACSPTLPKQRPHRAVDAGLHSKIYCRHCYASLCEMMHRTNVATQFHPTQASALGLAAVAAAVCLALHAWLANPKVYLVDFTVRRPDDSWKTTRISSALRAASKNFPRTALDFQFKMLWSSALGNETYIPPCEFASIFISSLTKQGHCSNRGNPTVHHN